MTTDNRQEPQTADDGPKELAPESTSLKIGSNEVLDLTGLSDDQVAQLKQQYATGMVDIANKAAELKVDVAALEATLNTLTDQATKATQENVHTTFSHTQTTSTGRTEAVVGNSERAATGKLSRSATGEQSQMLWIVGIIAVAAVLIFAVGD